MAPASPDAPTEPAPRPPPGRRPRPEPPSHEELEAFAHELDRPGCRLMFARVRHVLFVSTDRGNVFVARATPEGHGPIGWC